MAQSVARLLAAILVGFLFSTGAVAQPAVTPKTVAALTKLDSFRVFEDADQWVGAVRDLSEMGRDAVPTLTVKLAASRRGPTMAATAIALRVINDRRAVPALIYALRRVQPLASDFGITVPDPELHWFLWQYQTNSRAAPVRPRPGEPLSFGRSIREITATLESLTGHTEGTAHLSYYDEQGQWPKEGATATYERTRLVACVVADRWQAWWEANRQRLLTAEELAWVTANAPLEKPTAPPAAARSIQIEVRDGSRDRVLPGLELDIWIDFDHYRLTTDAAGLVQLPLPETIKWVSIIARREGLVPVLACFGPDDKMPQQFQMSIPASAAIGGVVRDDAGQPIRNASVFVTIPQKVGDHLWANILDQPTTTDAEGRWSCQDAPANLEVCLTRVVHPDFQSEPWYGSSTRTLASTVELREQRLLLVKPALAKIEGTAIDSATGQPLAGATVSAIDSQFFLRHYPDVQTDTQGHFTLTGIYPEKLNVMLSKTGYAPVGQALEPPHAARLELRATPSREPLRGRVVGPTGKPMGNAIVAAGPWQGHRLLSWHTLTDAEGQFTWPDHPEGTVQLRVHRTGFEVAMVDVVTTDPAPSIELAASLTIEGTVTDSKTGKPIDKFTIYPGMPWGPQDEPLFQRERGMPGDGGKYSISFTSRQSASMGAKGNRRLVRIDADGYLPFFSREFKDGEGLQTLDVQLEPAADIAGIVVGPDGKPVKDATVLMATQSQWASVYNGRNDQNTRGENLAATTDEQGRFALRPQREDYILVALHELGYAEAVANDFNLNKMIRLAPWGRVEITVMSGEKPKGGAEVSLSQWRLGAQTSGRVMNSLGGTTDANGVLVMDRVQPGHYSATTMSMARAGPGGPDSGVPLDAVAGETIKLILIEPPTDPQVNP